MSLYTEFRSRRRLREIVKGKAIKPKTVLKYLVIGIIPLLFALYPILYFYSLNMQEVPFNLLYPPVLIVLVLNLVSLGATMLLFRDLGKAAFITSILWILFFSYGHVFNIIDSSFPEFLSRHRYWLAVWLLGLAAVSYFTWRAKRLPKGVLQIVILVGVLLIAVPITTIVSASVGLIETDSHNYLVDNSDFVLSAATQQNRPNFYYIMLDSYPRIDTLSEYFNYDNSEFTNHLKSEGFFVSNQNFSNYNQTWASVPSTMNLSYLKDQDYLEGTKLDRLSAGVLIDLYYNNKVLRYLKDDGYSWIHNSNLYSTQVNPSADLNIKCGRTNEFMNDLINTTALLPFKLFDEQMRKNRSSDSECVMSNIDGRGNLRNPKFVFTHLFPPHPPYIFGENGEDVSETNLIISSNANWLDKQKYVAQLKYINRRITQIVNSILADNPDSVIIIQSDHGTLSSATKAVKLADKRPIVLKERSRNFFAVHLPNYCQGSELKSIKSNVNTFRVIFNSCFDAGYKILDDHIYYDTDGSDGVGRYTDFKEITDSVME